MIDADYLYARLPAAYRVRDAQAGLPLRALLSVLAGPGAAVEADIARLYDNWFIETCEDWVVPYVGDLLGVSGLRAVPGTAAYSPRTLVANTLRLRRRKGTVGALEEVAFDCTGWPVRAVEMFQLLATTQNVNHVRSFNHRTPDLRDSARLQLLDGPFDDVAHTASLRHLPNGRYNIPNVGLFAWRLQAYPLLASTARAVPGATAGVYTFDPLRRSLPLFNPPRGETEVSDLAGELNVPAPLRRRALFDELARGRVAIAAGRPPEYHYFDAAASTGPVIRVTVDGQAIPPDRLQVCNLVDIPGSAPIDWPRPVALGVAIDPELGRLALAPGVTATRVDVGFSYGFPGDVGGGPYDRQGVEARDPAAPATPTTFAGSVSWQLATNAVSSPTTFAKLTDALVALGALAPGARVLLEILDDASYDTGGATLDLPGVALVIQAANRRRPVLMGDLELKGDAGTGVTLNGLALDGTLALTGPLGPVALSHCTLSPCAGGLAGVGLGDDCTLSVRRSVCGRVTIAGRPAAITLTDCIVDGRAIGDGDQTALAAPDADLTLDRCTVIGTTRAQALSASDSIFTDVVTVERRQQGCVRFSYLPPASKTPRRYRCQPDLATAGLSAADAKVQQIRVAPVFTSEDFADPAYAQLSRRCADELRRGADDGSEMGVWSFLQQPQREANLRNSLDQYLRVGLDAALIFVT